MFIILAGYIKKKFDKVMSRIEQLNMSIRDYEGLEEEWVKQAESLCIRPDVSGLEKL